MNLRKLAQGRDCQVRIADISGFEGLYSITTAGEVISWRKGGHPLRHGVKPGGYAFVGLYKPGGKVSYKMVHRLVAQAFIDNPLGKPEVNHIDGVKLNNSIQNLEWATRAENAQHGHDTGLMAQGANHKMTKLTSGQVVEIFSMDGRYEDIGKKYGVCKQTVCCIKLKRIHKRYLAEAGL